MSEKIEITATLIAVQRDISKSWTNTTEPLMGALYLNEATSRPIWQAAYSRFGLQASGKPFVPPTSSHILETGLLKLAKQLHLLEDELLPIMPSPIEPVPAEFLELTPELFGDFKLYLSIYQTSSLLLQLEGISNSPFFEEVLVSSKNVGPKI